MENTEKGCPFDEDKCFNPCRSKKEQSDLLENAKIIAEGFGSVGAKLICSSVSYGFKHNPKKILLELIERHELAKTKITALELISTVANQELKKAVNNLEDVIAKKKETINPNQDFEILKSVELLRNLIK